MGFNSAFKGLMKLCTSSLASSKWKKNRIQEQKWKKKFGSIIWLQRFSTVVVKLLIHIQHCIFNFYGSVHCKYIPIYTQQDAMLHILFYLETALHVLGGTSTHHQERKQLYLQHLVLVRPLLLPAAIAAGSSNGLTNTRRCRYSCLRSWWWVEVPPETCRAVSRYK